MKTKEIYLAGGCYWGVEKYMSNIKGVVKTEVGFANGNTEAPTYKQVRYGNTGHAETVRVEYDPSEVSLAALLELFYKIIDPTSVDRQGEDVGHQYRTGVYYTNEEDADIIRMSRNRLERKTGEPLAMETCRLEQFWPAEEYHQKYLDKNPAGYCHVPVQLIQWVKTVDPDEWDFFKDREQEVRNADTDEDQPEVLDVIEHQGRTFVVVSTSESKASGEVVILELEDAGENTEHFAAVEEDGLLQEVLQIFKNRSGGKMVSDLINFRI